MNKKQYQNFIIFTSLGVFSYFICWFLGENIHNGFYIGGAFSLFSTIFFIYNKYEKLKKFENEEKVNRFKKKMEIFKVSGDIQILNKNLINRNFTFEKKKNISVFTKKTLITNEAFLISDISFKVEQDDLINLMFLEYQLSKKSGPMIYSVLTFDEKEVNMEQLKDFSLEYYKKHLDRQIYEFSLNENYSDPQAPLVMVLFYDNKDFFGYWQRSFLNNGRVKTFSKYLRKNKFGE